MALSSKQQALRAQGIGGSEIAAVAGLHPYMSPLDVYLRKVGEAPDQETTDHMMRGQVLGPAIVRLVEMKKGWTITHHDAHEETLISKRNPLVVATPDGLIRSAGRTSKVIAPIETKAPSFRSAHQWGEDGSDDIPDYNVPQTIWEMDVTACDHCEVAALLGDELRMYRIAWDAELYGVLVECAEKFWRDYVEKRVAPPPDGSPSYDSYLKAKFPRVTSQLLAADDAQRSLLDEYRSARQIADDAEKRVEELKQSLQTVIGSAEGIEAAGLGKVTWRICKGRQSIDWEAIARKLGANDDMIQEFTRQGNGYRRFLASFK